MMRDILPVHKADSEGKLNEYLAMCGVMCGDKAFSYKGVFGVLKTQLTLDLRGMRYKGIKNLLNLRVV